MNKFIVSSSPHIRAKDTTRRIMLDVIIALIPTSIAGCIIFGIRSLAVIAACTVAAVLSEFLFNLIVKKEQTVADLSAVVTGLLLALNLRADTPIWQCVIGSVFAIVVVKCLFGGIGCNFANPAVTARIFLFISFARTVGGGALPTIVELETKASPLELIGSATPGSLPSLWDMLLGLHSGQIGEVCSIAIIIGFIYLVARRVIHFETPLIFVGTVFVLSMIITNDPTLALYEILSGGLLIGAVFMATDYTTTPITRSGRMLFALGAGIITVVIRFYGSYPEGVSFAILIMNILSPYLERLTKKRPLGGKKNA